MALVQGPHIKYWGSRSFNSALLPLQSGYCCIETCQGLQWLPYCWIQWSQSPHFILSIYYQHNLTLTLLSLKCFPRLAPGHLISTSLLGCCSSVSFGGSSSSSCPLMLEHPGVVFGPLLFFIYTFFSSDTISLKYYEYAHGPYISTSILDVTLWIAQLNIWFSWLFHVDI